MIKSINIATINTVSGGTDLTDTLTANDTLVTAKTTSAATLFTDATVAITNLCICGQNYNGTTEYSVWGPQSGGMGLKFTVTEKPAIKSCCDCETFNRGPSGNLGYFTPDNK